MVLIHLEDILDGRLMRIHLPHRLLLNIYQPHLPIRLPVDQDLRVVLPRLPESR